MTKRITESVRRKYEAALSLADKLASLTTKTDTCWLWGGALDAYGYGQLAVPGCSPIKTHRLAWMLVHGIVAPSEHVLHRCDVRHCINPAHLFLGDQAANMKDAAAKGRLHVPRPNRRGVPLSTEHRAALAAAAQRRCARTRRQVA